MGAVDRRKGTGMIGDIVCACCEDALPWIPDERVDLIVTDPPYGWRFMGKDWDQAVPPVGVWRECLRVLKPGGFALVMSGPRMDGLSEMGKRLAEAGFETGFTPIFWAYASGFPKAMNMGKAVDKRLGAEREVVGHSNNQQGVGWSTEGIAGYKPEHDLTIPIHPSSVALDGSYGGFQPKPAVEVVIVAMKPLAHGTYVDQALDNGKGVTWLDEGRIPCELRTNPEAGYIRRGRTDEQVFSQVDRNKPRTGGYRVSARFPANLLVQDDVLNDGRITHEPARIGRVQRGWWDLATGEFDGVRGYGDSGSFSRYFSLDAWWQAKLSELPESVQRTLPFLIVPKAGKKEKNLGCEGLPHQERKTQGRSVVTVIDRLDGRGPVAVNAQIRPRPNHHPTVKPLKLMCYLITLGSRPGDLVLDPFAGTCTTGMGAKMLGRDWLMIEQEEKWCQIGRRRIGAVEERLL
jgi:hypothetical protein